MAKPTVPQEEENNPIQKLLVALQKNTTTMNTLLSGLNKMTKNNVASKQKEKSPEEIALDREKLALLQEKRKQAEIETKRQEDSAKKEAREEYKDSAIYRTATNIQGQQSNAMSAIAFSALTGGFVNPVIAKNLGLDKFVTAGVKAGGRGIIKGTQALGRGISNIFSSKPEDEEDETAGKSKKRESSAVEMDKDKNKKLTKDVSDIKTMLSKKADTKPDQIEEDDKKSDLTATLMKSAAGLALAFGALKTGITDMAGKGLSEMMKFFGAEDTTANVTGGIFKDALPGILFGAPFGMKTALICGGLALGANTLKKLWDDLTGKSEAEGKDPIGWGETAMRGAIAGGAMGLTFGLKGAIIGALLGAGGATISKAYKWLEGWIGGLIGLKKEEPETAQIPQIKDTSSASMSAENGGEVINTNTAEADAPANMDLTSGKVPLNQSFARNKPSDITPAILNNVQNVRSNLVDPLQDTLNKKGKGNKVTITSSFRGPAYNASVGGAKNSRHLSGKAVDLQVSGMNPNQVVSFMQQNGIPFDRAIAERSGNTQWLHAEYDSSGNHSGVVAQMDARTGKYQVTNPGSGAGSSSTPGTAIASVGRMETQNMATTEDNMSNTLSDMSMQLASNQSSGPSDMGGGMDTPVQTNMASSFESTQPAAMSGGSNLYMPNFGGMGDSQKTKPGTVYAYGDVAKTAILHTL